MSRLRIGRLHGPGVDAGALQIGDGDCVALHGPSGGGKSRLLRAIAELDPVQGDVWLDERPRDSFRAPDWRRQVCFLAADSHWWAARVGEHASGWRDSDLDALGFATDVLDWEVERLSSGERQRLALARALAQAPAALLLDEPSANLDKVNTERLEGLVADWRATTAGCVLWVSHSAAQRARVASVDYRVAGGVLQGHGDD